MTRQTFNLYDIGDPVRITIFTVDRNDAPADPTVLKLYLRNPTGTLTTLTYGTDLSLVKVTTGSYEVVVSPTVAGDWWYRWDSTGTATSGTEETRFRVRNRVVVAP